MTLKYNLQFFDYWHLSSGLSSGAKLDSIVVKDNDNIPYAPAKTIKGLLREMFVELFGCEETYKIFGFQSNEQDKCYDKDLENKSSLLHFKNATIPQDTKDEIVSNTLQGNLYDIIASTKIGEKNNTKETYGIAVTDSLREIEVVIPLTLEGEILDIPTKDDFDKLKKALKMIKRMGLNRNRGLGRCEFKDIMMEEL